MKEVVLLSEKELKQKGLDYVLELLKKGTEVFITSEGGHSSPSVVKLLYAKEIMDLSWKEIVEALRTTEEHLREITEEKEPPDKALTEKIETLYYLAKALHTVFSRESIKKYLRTKDETLGDIPLSLIKRGELELLYRDFANIVYNIPL